ncbi:hypothetical protein [Nesterenkonia cremea]|uniref:Uncharacterized protein n=1 Tax=Nesterenkonia cremea TaxID=1882340 RepID=A0A917AWZ4_9MICC|nr:hypothetical protein [Nesterenkonia cremea]GGE78533.1 hypothetical protein GCM10011401_27240 [Nesterenkonia cremea]
MQRQCPNCLQALDEDAPAQQIYCAPRCREAAKKRRLRGNSAPDARDALDTSTRQLQQLTTQVGQMRQRIAERDDTIRQLRSELRSERRRIDRIAQREGKRTRTVQQQLTAAKAELAAATAGGDRSAAPATGRTRGRGRDRSEELAEELAAVKDRLAAGQAAYRQLSAEREDLAEMLIEADRRHTVMATVITHWDQLAGRLQQAVAGQPATAISREDTAILSYWSRARDRLLDHASRPHRTRPRPDTSGHAADSEPADAAPDSTPATGH